VGRWGGGVWRMFRWGGRGGKGDLEVVRFGGASLLSLDVQILGHYLVAEICRLCSRDNYEVLCVYECGERHISEKVPLHSSLIYAGTSSRSCFRGVGAGQPNLD